MADQLPLSLEDLDNPETPEEQQAREQKEAADKEAQEKAEAEAKEKEEQERLAKEEEERNKAEEGKEPKEGEEELEDDEEVVEKFYEQVNKQHGFEDFQVDYPEGVDPLSPEGTYIREKALIERAEQNFDKTLKETNPRAYAFFLHTKAGKDEAEFFSNPSVTLPEYSVFEKDVDLQKRFVEKDLQLKGLDQDLIDAAIEKAIKEGKLFEKADKAYKAIEKKERDALASAEQESQQRIQAEAKAVQEITSYIDDIITNSKTSNIVIPDAKKAEFAQYVKQHLFFDGKEFFVFKGLSKENAAELIQAEYFGFAKGNLNELVARKAKTENTSQLRRRIKKDEASSRGKQEHQVNSGFIPLADI